MVTLRVFLKSGPSLGNQAWCAEVGQGGADLGDVADGSAAGLNVGDHALGHPDQTGDAARRDELIPQHGLRLVVVGSKHLCQGSSGRLARDRARDLAAVRSLLSP